MMKNFLNSISLIVIGLGIGWLVGLSVEAGTTSNVLTSIMTIVILLITVVSGLERDTSEQEHLKWRVSPIPIALFMIGIMVGSPMGIYVRTHQWLELKVEGTINTPENSRAGIGALFVGGHDECERLSTYRENKLPEQLKNSPIAIFQVLEPNLLLHEIVAKQCAVLQKGEK